MENFDPLGHDASISLELVDLTVSVLGKLAIS